MPPPDGGQPDRLRRVPFLGRQTDALVRLGVVTDGHSCESPQTEEHPVPISVRGPTVLPAHVRQDVGPDPGPDPRPDAKGAMSLNFFFNGGLALMAACD